MAAQFPRGRVGSPDEIAKAVVFLRPMKVDLLEDRKIQHLIGNNPLGAQVLLLQPL
jgi:hypothetical protein